MDLYATFASPAQTVFGHLADPSYLGNWLPDVTTAGSACPDEAEFPLTVHLDGSRVAASGEMTAYEPPWLVGYRLFIGAQAHSLRVTCTAQAGGTLIHIHQPDGPNLLTIDLARLAREIP